jgi:hypothetical protein
VPQQDHALVVGSLVVALAVALALVAAVAAFLPLPGIYLAMGTGLVAVTMGWLGWRRRTARGPLRLWAAAAITIALFALIVATTRYGLILAVIGRLQKMLS